MIEMVLPFTHGQEQPTSSLPGPSTAELLHDTGSIAKASASIDDICLKLCNLSSGERFNILFQPPTSFPAQQFLMGVTGNLMLAGYKSTCG